MSAGEALGEGDGGFVVAEAVPPSLVVSSGKGTSMLVGSSEAGPSGGEFPEDSLPSMMVVELLTEAPGPSPAVEVVHCSSPRWISHCFPSQQNGHLHMVPSTSSS